MDLNRVAIFVRVVDEGGFTAAAKALGLPKSSVSRAVALLEEELGLRLLQRSTRRVTLTEAGAAFHARAGAGLLAVSEARDAVVDLDGSLRGPIRITAPVDAGAWVLSPLIAAFTREHPAVHVEVVLTARMVDLVDEGFDLAFRAGPLREELLVARKLPAVDAALYASPGYLAEHGTPERVADLADHRCVIFRGARGRTTWTLVGRDSDAQQVEVSGPISADDFSFVLHAVVAGAGIGLIPSFVTSGSLPAQVTRVLPDHRAPGAPLHLIYPSARYVPRRVAALRDFIVQSLGPPSAREATR